MFAEWEARDDVWRERANNRGMTKAANPNPPGPPARPPRSVLTILGQGMVFLIAAVVLGSISYRLIANRRVNGGPPVPAVPDHIPWRTDLASALDDSRKTGKPVLVDFSAGWCPPCQRMRHDAWPDPRVGQAVRENYIPVLMDADRPESEKPAAHYDIEAIPALLVLDGNGNVVRQGAFMSADQLLAFLREGKGRG